MEDKQLQIGLDFNQQLQVKDSFTINLLDENNNKYNITTTFVERRLGPFQTVIGADLNGTVQNLKKSIDLDYGRVFSSTITSSGILLQSIRPNWAFDNIAVFPPDLSINAIPEYIPLQAFYVKSVEYLPSSTDKCNKVKVKITTSLPMTSYCTESTCYTYDSNILELESFRGTGFTIDLVRNSLILTRNILTPPLIEDGYDNIIVLSILNGLNGGSVTINAPFSSQLQHQFSLDNINWQTDNSFSGLLEGHYTVYIKDKYGCSRSKDFVIDPYVNNFIIKSDDYSYISKSNSFRFAERVDFTKKHKTDENTLSCEMDVIKPYKQIQTFKSIDVIKTQFKSNYKFNKAFVVQGNVQSELTIQRKTNNLDLTDSRTAIKFNLGSGKTGIYFLSGTRFDFDTGAPIGPYELNGYLPEWGKKGNRFKMNNTWFQIQDIYYDDIKNADVIIINNVYTGMGDVTIVSAKYNKENYNVFEFSISMNSYLDSKFKVRIVCENGAILLLHKKQEYLSEDIHVVANYPNTVEIRYKNKDNNDVLYSTGIEHLLRIPYNKVSGVDVNTSDNHKTDDKVILLEADIYESNKFDFEPLTKELWRKLKIALSHDTVFIDSIGYVKESDFETEGPLGQTNLYVLSVNMVKNGSVYSSTNTNDIIIVDPGNPMADSSFINVNSEGFMNANSEGFIEQ